MIKQLSPTQAKAHLDSEPGAIVLDVRELWELQLATLNRPFIHIPMQSIPSRLSELPQDGSIVCLCHHGIRSMQVAAYLARQGFKQVINLAGGIESWSQSVDTTVPQY